jgi:hypothetical protein
VGGGASGFGPVVCGSKLILNSVLPLLNSVIKKKAAWGPTSCGSQNRISKWAQECPRQTCIPELLQTLFNSAFALIHSVTRLRPLAALVRLPRTAANEAPRG